MIYIKSTEAAQWTYPDYPEGSERKAFIEQPKEELIQLLIDTGQGKYVQAGWELYGDVHGGSIRKGLKTTLEPHKGTDRSPFRSWK